MTEFWRKYEPRESGICSLYLRQLQWSLRSYPLYARMCVSMVQAFKGILNTFSQMFSGGSPVWELMSFDHHDKVRCLLFQNHSPALTLIASCLEGNSKRNWLWPSRVALKPAVTFHLEINHFWINSELGLWWKGLLKVPTKLLWRGWFSLTPPMLAGWLISGQLTMLAAAR